MFHKPPFFPWKIPIYAAVPTRKFFSTNLRFQKHFLSKIDFDRFSTRPLSLSRSKEIVITSKQKSTMIIFRRLSRCSHSLLTDDGVSIAPIINYSLLLFTRNYLNTVQTMIFSANLKPALTKNKQLNHTIINLNRSSYGENILIVLNQVIFVQTCHVKRMNINRIMHNNTLFLYRFNKSDYDILKLLDFPVKKVTRLKFK